MPKEKSSSKPKLPAKKKAGGGCPSASCPPVVTWQAAKLRSMNDEAVALNAWVLAVDGKTILTAVAVSEIFEAVTPENRKMIGQALAEYLVNANSPSTGATE